MTDSISPEATSFTPAESLSAVTAGQMIRAARQQQGLHLAVLSLKLKVSVRQLEALEADQHDRSKGPVFVRALASSVCRQLRMDAAPVLALLPQAPGQLPVLRNNLTPLQSERHAGWSPVVGKRSWPRQTLVIALIMLALIAALLWMPSPSSWTWLQTPPTAAVTAEPTLALPETSVPAEQSVQTMPVEPLITTPATASAPGVAELAANVQSAAASPAAGILAFSAREDSWIEIRDGQNRVLWSRVVRGGESTQVQYPLPLHVVVGRAAVVQVTYQGKPFDLVPHTKVSVARFEVKE